MRSRTETTPITLAPGISDRISVSIGLASAPNQANDRIALLRLADEALYEAKEAGRNRVVSVGGLDGDQAALRALASESPPTTVASAGRRRARTAGA
jgi:predicted signal transduction protein with EAL and GGDEF domain